MSEGECQVCFTEQAGDTSETRMHASSSSLVAAPPASSSISQATNIDSSPGFHQISMASFQFQSPSHAPFRGWGGRGGGDDVTPRFAESCSSLFTASMFTPQTMELKRQDDHEANHNFLSPLSFHCRQNRLQEPAFEEMLPRSSVSTAAPMDSPSATSSIAASGLQTPTHVYGPPRTAVTGSMHSGNSVATVTPPMHSTQVSFTGASASIARWLENSTSSEAPRPTHRWLSGGLSFHGAAAEDPLTESVNSADMSCSGITEVRGPITSLSSLLAQQHQLQACKGVIQSPLALPIAALAASSNLALDVPLPTMDKNINGVE